MCGGLLEKDATGVRIILELFPHYLTKSQDCLDLLLMASYYNAGGVDLNEIPFETKE